MDSKILFVVDELEFKWFESNKLVTNFWLIEEFLKENLIVEITTKTKLFIKNAKGYTICHSAYINEKNEIAYENTEKTMEIENFNAVFFRPDPPVDVNYINACNIFEFVNTTNTVLINNPLTIRNFNEKMHVNLFPQFAPENIVTNSQKNIIEFLNTHEKIVIKPLNRCFGSGVFTLKKGEENISSIISTATENEKTNVMVQKYLKGAINGDKRVLIINGEVMDECVQKLPAQNDFKFAEHSDKYFAKSELTIEEKYIAQAIATKLKEIGLPMAGLDMIDNKVIEINITSPCYFIKEINNLYNTSFEKKIIPKILKMCNIETKCKI